MQQLRLTTAPHVSQVNPDSSGFRQVLTRAGRIVKCTPFGVYSRHFHYPLADTEVLFEEWSAATNKLTLRPMPDAEAREQGLPSCWAIQPDGSCVVLRYASKELFEQSGVNTTSPGVLWMLSQVSRQLAEADLHPHLELNVAHFLFPVPKGHVTLEMTNPAARRQEVTFVKPSAEQLASEATAACWTFDSSTGEPTATGFCANEYSTSIHPVSRPEPEPEDD